MGASGAGVAFGAGAGGATGAAGAICSTACGATSRIGSGCSTGLGVGFGNGLGLGVGGTVLGSGFGGGAAGSGSGATNTPTTLGGVMTGSLMLSCCAAHAKPSACNSTTPIKVMALPRFCALLLRVALMGVGRIFIKLLTAILLVAPGAGKPVLHTLFANEN